MAGARWSSGQCYLKLLRDSVGTLSRWSWLYLQSVPTKPHWARVVDYGPFSLWVIHKEGLCPSSRNINVLMIMMMMNLGTKEYHISPSYFLAFNT
jgi:hypothetical protein